MKLTTQLALSQLKVNKRRTTWTLVGITLATAALTAVFGLGLGSGHELATRLFAGTYQEERFNNIFIGLAMVLALFIILIGIIVVSNAFRVSAGDRYTQFGVLRSTGATGKQIRQTIAAEGTFLSLIGIPVGLLIGMGIHYLSMLIINHYLEAIDPTFAGNSLRFVVSPLVFLVAIVVSLVTVFVAAWLPARRAAKVSAIEAIHGVGEVKAKNAKVRLTKPIKRTFGSEGVLAATFLRRSKRSYRATVIALTFSVILVVAAGGLASMLHRSVDLMFSDTLFGAQTHTEISPDLGFTIADGVAAADQLQTYLQPGDDFNMIGFNRTGKNCAATRQYG